MVKCWMDDPVDRPTFTEIVKNIDHMLAQNSGYLHLVDFMVKACEPSIEVTDKRKTITSVTAQMHWHVELV